MVQGRKLNIEHVTKNASVIVDCLLDPSNLLDCLLVELPLSEKRKDGCGAEDREVLGHREVIYQIISISSSCGLISYRDFKK